MKKIRLVLAVAASGLAAACVTPAPTPQPAPQPVVPVSALSNAPDLSPYERIELYSQSSSASEQPLQLQARYATGQARFEVKAADGAVAGRLHVQPEACRDDPNEACERRFTINGRLQAFGANLSCTVPVRNDVKVGYSAQTLSGLCQSQYGRAYTIQMFPR